MEVRSNCFVKSLWRSEVDLRAVVAQTIFISHICSFNCFDGCRKLFSRKFWLYSGTIPTAAAHGSSTFAPLLQPPG